MPQSLRELREGRGLSIRELASQLGVSHMSVHHWEMGNRMPRADQWLALARFFGVAAEDITLPGVPDGRKDTSHDPR